MEQSVHELLKNKNIKEFDFAQLDKLSAEIRQKLIDTVSCTGGHLSSNLGVVELAIALHRVFDLPRDTIIWDVGHQSYPHKLLSGRWDRFGTLRQKDGISGFPKCEESESDCFNTGHSGTSLSAALGFARAKQMCGDKSHTIAVVGDGSLLNGMVYEAMNNIDDSLSDFIVVLNDNSMSISKSVGSMARYLMKLRTSSAYFVSKNRVERFLNRIPILGKALVSLISAVKRSLRRGLYKQGTLFEELGFTYLGPVDGHDIAALCTALESIKEHGKGPVLLHVETQKGKGYGKAEKNPGAYHGVSHFDPDEGNPDISEVETFSSVLGRSLCEAAQKDESVCAVTAAMKYATGLQFMAKSFPQRFFDVGIAEEHAVTFCAGLAAGGMKPVFAVYSTFLQRAYDQILHDVCLQDLNVLFAVDRAGIVGEDGETHQGIYDCSFLSSFKNITAVSPSNYAELKLWVERLLSEYRGPKVIRYPRGREDAYIANYTPVCSEYDLIQNGAKKLVVTYGRMFANCLCAVDSLAAKGEKCDILKLNVIAPLCSKAVDEAMNYDEVFFVEEGVRTGGIGEHFCRMLSERGYRGRFLLRAIDALTLPASTVDEAFTELGLDAGSLQTFFEGEGR